jgi:hypothetical protein
MRPQPRGRLGPHLRHYREGQGFDASRRVIGLAPRLKEGGDAKVHVTVPI